MNSKQFVSVFVLVILTALPVSGSVCTLICDATTSSATAGHHGSAQDCEEPAPSSAGVGVEIRAVSEHDCSTHDTALRPASQTAADRVNVSAPSIPLVGHIVTGRFTSALDARPLFQNGSPPGTAPPTIPPLVLRI